MLSVCCAVLAVGAAAPAALAKQRLRAFDSCTSLVRYAQQHTAARSPVAPLATTEAPTPAAAPDGRLGAEADDVSTTNVQEAGVDEPDVVKATGSHLLAIAGGVLHAVDARAATPALVGSLELPAGHGHELLVSGGWALVIQSGDQAAIGLPQPRTGVAAIDLMPVGPPTTVLTEIDVSDPSAMRVVRSLTFQGSPVGARLTGHTARIVASSSPYAHAGVGVRRRARGWIPIAKLAGPAGRVRESKRLVPCRSVRRTAAYSGSGLLSVLTVDLAKGLPAAAVDALMTDAHTVYASPRSLYVATQRRNAAGADTAIHRFDASVPGATAYRASGTVPGHLLNQLSLSEHDGVLRAATTQDGRGGASESFVTTLRPEGGRLVEIGRVGGLGVGERIYAVRFIGATGYVVTFRQTDPLYTLDLSDPARPRVVGELKILGYSAYLHPVGDGLLLGVGRDATEEGRVQGVQLSLFDVSDPARPTRLQQHTLAASSSAEAEWDHHAFLWWPATRLAVLPVSERAFDGAIGFRVERGGIGEVGRVAPRQGRVRRTTVVGDRVFALSDAGVAVSALGDLAPQAWIAFPGVPELPPGPKPLPAEAG